MYYATENGVTAKDMSGVDGWIAITPEQYAAALAGVQSGQIIAIDGGFAVIDPPKNNEG